MVQSVSELQEPSSPAEPVGKVHPGFTLALALAAPGGMVLVAALVALLINGATGQTGVLWLGATALLTGWGVALLGSMLLAEAEG
ncbi:MAG TPA: hypothetical protein ENK18_21575 [Deltaproteobacteria bacterium]|nr:hypothetical protein [Deltaproteobacteria bacterium]